MFSARPKAFIRSLRFRLILWNAVAVLLTVAAVLYFVRQGVGTELRSEMDLVLMSDLDDIVRRVEDAVSSDLRTLRTELELRSQDHQHDRWYVAFLDQKGERLWASSRAPAPVIAELADKQFVDRRGFRILQTRLRSPVGDVAVVRVGASYAALHESLNRIDRVAMLVGMGMLALAPILGVILALRAIAPLSQLVETAEGLRPGRGMERLPTRDAGDELDRLAEAFNRLLDRMGDYLRQKHDFLNNAAHELRTPLAAIRSTVEVQLDRPDLAEDQREVLTQVIEETAALHHLVSQLLTLASSDVDRLASHAEPVNLTNVTRDAVEMFRAVAEVSDISIISDLTPNCIVEGNQNSLRQVLNNLLDNAIKFTAIAPTAGHPSRPRQVTVRLVGDSASSTVRLTVADTGIGVAAEDVPRLGERFYRVDKARQRSTGVGGTGLGLSICKAIIDAHRGQLDIASDLGTGTTVTITIPLMAVMSKESRLDATNTHH